MPSRLRWCAALLGCLTALGRPAPEILPQTTPWTVREDFALRMVDGLSRDLGRRAQGLRDGRGLPPADDATRTHLASLLGVERPTNAVRFRLRWNAPRNTEAGSPLPTVPSPRRFEAFDVEWDAFDNVSAEGLLLVPHGETLADVVALPDCDQTPEQVAGLDPSVPESLQFARRLVESGCRVLVPAFVDRGQRFAGNPVYRTVRQSQRETLWRAGYEVGHHLAGMEAEMVLTGAEALRGSRPGGKGRPLGLAGHGEGGWLALLVGALDPRFDAVVSSGAFGLGFRGNGLPIERDVWAFEKRFGDAELAAMISPRGLVLERGRYPTDLRTDEGGGAPGRLDAPSDAEFGTQVRRLRDLPARDAIEVVETAAESVLPTRTVARFLDRLGVSAKPDPLPEDARIPDGPGTDPAARTRRLYQAMLEHTQRRMRASAEARKASWKEVDRKDEASFLRTVAPLRRRFEEEVLGKLPAPTLPANARSRLIFEKDGIRGYEVVFDVFPDVEAGGILVLPADVGNGTRHPVVVCQHGLEGRPADVADPTQDSPFYHRFAFRLAERGYVTFSPQNPYTGGTRFRQVLRQARPLGLTLWSYIVRQHEVITEWLASRPYVDPARIGFYGLSYGGKTAMRVPAVLDRYALSICSADYNEWILKNVSADSPYSYLWTMEYDMPEWNLAGTFNYAEMSWLVFPRPFMVERGHDDGVAPDEWVAFEYARTRRHYVKLGRADRTEIEFFDGPHSIHGDGTFRFLDRHLGVPER